MSVRSRRGENMASWAMSRDSEGEGIVGWGMRWRSFVDVGVRSCCLCFLRTRGLFLVGGVLSLDFESEWPVYMSPKTPHLHRHPPAALRPSCATLPLSVSSARHVITSIRVSQCGILKSSSPGELHPQSSLARAVPRKKDLALMEHRSG